MQINHNLLYELTAQRTGKSEDKYKEIGNMVFKSLQQHIKRPKSLIIKLKGVGAWYLRRNRIEKTVELFPPDFENVPVEEQDNAFSKLKVLQYENKVEIYNIFLERIKDYNQYVAEKQQIRSIRNKTQKLIEIKDEE